MSMNIKTVGAARFYIESPVDLDIIDEVWTRNVYKVAPHEGLKVLEIGAHKGTFSIFCALGGAYVKCYEPDPRTFDSLQRNIEMNGVGSKITAINAAVWSENATLALHQNPGNPGGNNIHCPDRPCVSACDALPLILVRAISFSEAVGNEEWDVLKIDCEGSEYEFLTKAPSDALSLIRYLTMEVHDWSGIEAYRCMVHRLSKLFIVDGEGRNGEKFYYIHAQRRKS